MANPTVRFKWLPDADQSVELPEYQTAGAAGADVRANFGGAGYSAYNLAPGERVLVPTGLAIAVEDGYEVQVRPRSGLALKNGITVVNAPGTVDCDYRGPLGVILLNTGTELFVIKHGDRIAQLVVSPVSVADFVLVDNLDETERGAGGYGSTGV